MKAKKKAAATVLQIAPFPPAIEVPPTITAVSTANTKLKSSDGCADIDLEELTIPANADAPPRKIKVVANSNEIEKIKYFRDILAQEKI